MSTPTTPSPRRLPLLGFITAVIMFGAGFLAPGSPELGMVLPYIVGITLLPLCAIVLALIPKTRRFGLGMLLGCGLVWLVMLGICGGLIKI